jgi:hypothetical protein
MPRSLHDRLRPSFDALQGRRLLDRIETGVRPHYRHRRVNAVMKLPRREDFIQRTKGEQK